MTKYSHHTSAREHNSADWSQWYKIMSGTSVLDVDYTLQVLFQSVKILGKKFDPHNFLTKNKQEMYQPTYAGPFKSYCKGV